ncbi:RDD family protein [Candidatus Bathyarchaeota archaeon]|nr:RDD family protein [Candidatus Bathyarchaeota archaeon]
MSTGFERIGRDARLQDHWIRRLVAFIIDSIIVGIGTSIIVAIITIPFHFFTFPFFAGVLSILYFALLEFYYGWTVGKKIMNLKTIELGGHRPALDLAFIRNISKIYWILVLIDVIIGLATLGDPHQKISDRMAGTTVVSRTAPPLPPPPPTP